MLWIQFEAGYQKNPGDLVYQGCPSTKMGIRDVVKKCLDKQRKQKKAFKNNTPRLDFIDSCITGSQLFFFETFPTNIELLESKIFTFCKDILCFT